MALPRLALALLAVLALAVPAAEAASLPAGGDGERPGPPLLYRGAPAVPQLSVRAPFRAAPLLVSGTDAYRGGEYLYQDYLFDDRGANTVSGRGSRADDEQEFSPAAGDVLYPSGDRYADNAADLVEFRVKPDGNDIVYRVSLNTVKADDAAIVGIGIDADRSGGTPVLWPGNAGMSSPGLDFFVRAWGTGGRLSTCAAPACASGGTPLDVSIDRETNQMTIRVPRSVMDPESRVVNYTAGVGLFDGGEGFKAALPGSRGTGGDQPTSGGLAPASGVFNLAFRFSEPQTKTPFLATRPSGSTPGAYDTFPGIGNWFEDEQAEKLRRANTEDFLATVDFSKLAGGNDETIHESVGCREAREASPQQGCEQARILPSSLRLPEGVDPQDFPEYGGQLQPYLLTVPPGASGGPRGLTFSLHSLGGNYTQYKVFSPTQLRQFGDGRGNFVVTPLGHGPDGWYSDEGEADVFEVWADVARHFELDSERVALTGYSMGGYGTYKLGVEYPDLFGRAFTTVGPPARGLWTPPPEEGGRYPPPMADDNRPGPSQDTNTHPRLENLRWIPFMNWVGQDDQLVPYPGPRREQARFDALDLRSTLWTFFPADHFALATLDRWDKAAEFLGDARVTRDPARVNFAFFPAADRPELGLVHDHAYWLSDVRARDESAGAGEQFADAPPGAPQGRAGQGVRPARGEVDARSLAFGEDDPSTSRVFRTEPAAGPPLANTVEGTEWTGLGRREPENALELRLANVSRARIAGSRARLDSEREIRVRLESDGDAEVRLDLQLPADSVVMRDGSNDEADNADVDPDGARFRVGAGTSTFVIARRKPAASSPSGEAPPAVGSGARAPACLPRVSRIGSRGIGPVRLGRSRAGVLFATGLPARSARRAERFCLRGGGKLLVSFSRNARVRLAVVVAPGPLARGIGRGSSVGRLLGRYPAARSTLRGILAPSRGSSALFGVKGTRVRFVAVADRRLRADPALLASHLRRLGLR